MKLKREVGTYGTLRVGHGNWNYYLRGVPCVDKDVELRGYQMRTFGGYPAIFYTGQDCDIVLLDVFDVSDAPSELIESMDRMEIGAGYYLKEERLDNGRIVDVYVMPDEDMDGFPELIESGDWNEYCDRRANERGW